MKALASPSPPRVGCVRPWYCWMPITTAHTFGVAPAAAVLNGEGRGAAARATALPGQAHAGHRRTAEILGVEDHQLAVVRGGVIDDRHHPAVVLGGVGAAGHEDTLARDPTRAEVVHRRRPRLQVVLQHRTVGEVDAD